MKTGSMKRFAGVLAALLVLGLAATAWPRASAAATATHDGRQRLRPADPEKQAAVDRLVAEHREGHGPAARAAFRQERRTARLENQQNRTSRPSTPRPAMVGTARRMFDEARPSATRSPRRPAGPWVRHGLRRGYAMMGGSGMGFGRGNCPPGRPNPGFSLPSFLLPEAAPSRGRFLLARLCWSGHDETT
jgi:hypothetical protein